MVKIDANRPCRLVWREPQINTLVYGLRLRRKQCSNSIDRHTCGQYLKNRNQNLQLWPIGELMNVLLFVAALVLVVLSNTFAASIAKRDSILHLIEQKRFPEADSAIRDVRSADSLDPDYFILSINYYFCVAERPGIEIRQGDITAESLIALYDAQGNQVGGIIDHSYFDRGLMLTGIGILDSGIALYPDRLDMRFGKVYTCFESRLLRESADALKGILSQHRTKGSEWKLDREAPLLKEADEYVLENVQSYVRDFYDLSSPLSDSIVEEVSREIIATFPNSAYGYTNISSILRLQGNFDSSLAMLGQACRIDPSDPIVVINLAITAEEAGKVKLAVEYFTKLLSIGDVDQQALAREHLEKLRDQN